MTVRFRGKDRERLVDMPQVMGLLYFLHVAFHRSFAHPIPSFNVFYDADLLFLRQKYWGCLHAAQATVAHAVQCHFTMLVKGLHALESGPDRFAAGKPATTETYIRTTGVPACEAALCTA